MLIVRFLVSWLHISLHFYGEPISFSFFVDPAVEFIGREPGSLMWFHLDLKNIVEAGTKRGLQNRQVGAEKKMNSMLWVRLDIYT